MELQSEASAEDSDEPLYWIEQLTSQHERATFACGNETLDRFLREQALSWQKRDLATTYVLVSNVQPFTVQGYFSISMTRIVASDLPAEVASKFPRTAEIGAILLGKLAVNRILQGRGLGRDLLSDAIERSLEMRGHVAAYAMVVDAIDGEAKAFYERFGFHPFPETPMRLFLPFKLHLARTGG
jgi:GNAT superfamily N-acetyltransferase